MTPLSRRIGGVKRIGAPGQVPDRQAPETPTSYDMPAPPPLSGNTGVTGGMAPGQYPTSTPPLVKPMDYAAPPPAPLGVPPGGPPGLSAPTAGAPEDMTDIPPPVGMASTGLGAPRPPIAKQKLFELLASRLGGR